MNPAAKVIISMERPGSPEAMRKLAEIIVTAITGELKLLFAQVPEVSYAVQIEVPKVDVDPIETPEATYPEHHEGRTE